MPSPILPSIRKSARNNESTLIKQAYSATYDPPPFKPGRVVLHFYMPCSLEPVRSEKTHCPCVRCGVARGQAENVGALQTIPARTSPTTGQQTNKMADDRGECLWIDLVGSNYRLSLVAEMAWVEPSHEEKQLMAEKRKTRDRISSQMGQYLLKGYKMLDKTCESCTVSDSMSLTLLGSNAMPM